MLFRVVSYQHVTDFRDGLIVQNTCLTIEPVTRKDLVTGGTVYNRDGMPQTLYLGGHVSFKIGSIHELVPHADTKEV